VGALAGVGVKVVLAGLLGFGLRRKGFVTAELAQDLGKLLLSVIAPFAIVAAATRPYQAELASSLYTTLAVSVTYFVLAVALGVAVSRMTPMEVAERRALVCLSTFPNMTFIGMPIVAELFGAAGLLCAVVANLVFNLFFFTFAENYMGSVGFKLKTIVTSPVVIACVVAVVIFFGRLPVPDAFGSAFAMLGGAMAPIAMMIVGFGLAESYLGELIRNPFGYLAGGMRLLFWPVLVLVAGRLLGLDTLAVNSATILFAMPCGTMTVMLAARSGRAYRFCAQSVVQSNAMMFLTLPGIYWLIQIWP